MTPPAEQVPEAEQGVETTAQGAGWGGTLGAIGRVLNQETHHGSQVTSTFIHKVWAMTDTSHLQATMRV